MNWHEKGKLKPEFIQGKCDCLPEEADYDSGRLQVLNQHIESFIREGRICSGSYCLWRHGKIFADVSLGRLAMEWQGNIKFRPDTFFEIQSVTKVFAAIAILKLAEDGILYLGQPVCEWIPEFNKPVFRDITILHLLTHTSGLCALPGAWPEDERKWWENMDEKNVKASWIPAIIKTGLHSNPGEKWIYSAVGFPLLGEIIERSSGVEAKSFIRDNILNPCGMEETHWRTDGTAEWARRYNICNETDLRLARGAQEQAMNLCQRTYQWWDDVPEMSGGVMSTGREMVRLGEMILRNGEYKGRRIIGRKALDYLWKNQVSEKVKDECWNHPGYPVVYGAGMPIIQTDKDLLQVTSDSVIYHEGSGGCVFLLDKTEDFAAMYQLSFVREGDWCWEAMRGTASIIWSGIQ